MKTQRVQLYEILKTFRMLVQNLLLILVYNQYGDVLFYAIVDYKTSAPKSALSIFSLMLSMIFLIIGSAITGLHLRFLIKQQRLRKQNDTEGLNKHYNENMNMQVFFRSCKRNKMYQQIFIFLYPIRDLLQNLILGVLFEHPTVQAVLMFLISLTIFTYLIIVRPLRSIFDQGRQIILELLVLLSNLVVLIMAGYDRQKLIKLASRKQIGEMILYNITAVVSLAVKATLVIRKAYIVHKRSPNIPFYRGFQSPAITIHSAREVIPLQTNINDSAVQNDSSRKNIINTDRGGVSQVITHRISEISMSGGMAASRMEDTLQIAKLDSPNPLNLSTIMKSSKSRVRRTLKNITAAANL